MHARNIRFSIKNNPLSLGKVLVAELYKKHCEYGLWDCITEYMMWWEWIRMSTLSSTKIMVNSYREEIHRIATCIIVDFWLDWDDIMDVKESIYGCIYESTYIVNNCRSVNIVKTTIREEDKKDSIPEEDREALKLSKLAQKYQKQAAKNIIELEQKKLAHYKKYWTLIQKIWAYKEYYLNKFKNNV